MRGCQLQQCRGKCFCNRYRRAKNGETFEIDSENYTFIPMYGGVYTITVVCEDYIDRVEKTFDIEIDSSDQPQIFDTPELPEYFILGARYNLSNLNGYDFTTGQPQEKQASVSVSEDGRRSDARHCRGLIRSVPKRLYGSSIPSPSEKMQLPYIRTSP